MPHECPHCDREFPASRALEDHMDRAHPDAGEPTDWTRVLLVGLFVLAAGAVAAALVLGGSGGSGEGLNVQDSPRTGNDSAPVQMIAFESPACTSCRLFHVSRGGEPSTFSRVIEDYVEPGQVLYVEKFARAGYGWDRIGANAQRCAWELGGWSAFESLTQAYYSNRNQIDRSNSDSFAIDWARRSDEVNTRDFEACFEENRFNDKLGRDLADGDRADVEGTPTFLIRSADGSNERRIVGPQPYSTFANALDAAIAQATAPSDANDTQPGGASGDNETQASRVHTQHGLETPALAVVDPFAGTAGS